ncbi:hypothetical protein BDR04DRAFT_851822 [Suillus decipiens]|nr:hypothetical protein BDR04DRAFT_851822 [Suillus decipiens]
MTRGCLSPCFHRRYNKDVPYCPIHHPPSTDAWSESQLLTYTHRVITFGSHYSYVKLYVDAAAALLSVCCFFERGTIRCCSRFRFGPCSRCRTMWARVTMRSAVGLSALYNESRS